MKDWRRSEEAKRGPHQARSLYWKTETGFYIKSFKSSIVWDVSSHSIGSSEQLARRFFTTNRYICMCISTYMNVWVWVCTGSPTSSNTALALYWLLQHWTLNSKYSWLHKHIYGTTMWYLNKHKCSHICMYIHTDFYVKQILWICTYLCIFSLTSCQLPYTPDSRPLLFVFSYGKQLSCGRSLWWLWCRWILHIEWGEIGVRNLFEWMNACFWNCFW